ncbi:MAG TPA: MFS transporter [Burkholderiales bacterium]|nr:MFS transporter [Burkholderiales bacterium]
MPRTGDALVIGLVALAHGLSHFFQLIIAPLFPLIKEELGVSYAALGFVVMLFYTLSALFQPVAGFVVDRFGGRAVLLGGVGCLTLGTLIAGAAPSYGVLVAGAALAGMGNSVFHPADFSILNARVGVQRLGYAYSAHGIAGSLGYASAPIFSGGLGTLIGWHNALFAATGVGAFAFLLLLTNWNRLHMAEAPGKRPEGKTEFRILFAAPVVMCFLYFAIYAAGLAGLQSFSVSAMTVQYGVAAALASSALTAYMIGSAAGIFAGGFIATRTTRHDLVAAAGLALSASVVSIIAISAVPGTALPAMLALAGFCVGATAPSRDMIVRASTPAGATGRVYGFVYSGLDVGSLSTPVFYGWLMDHNLPQGVFYTVAGLTLLAMFTVLQLPGTKRAIQRI